MSNFSLDDLFVTKDGREITISLSTANKYMTKLKSHQSAEREEVTPSYGRRKPVGTNVPAKTSVTKILMRNIHSENDNFQSAHILGTIDEEIKTESQKIVSAYTKTKRVFWDITTLKNKIFYTNGYKGIDTILSKLDLLQSLKSDFASLNKNLEGSHDLNLLVKMYNKSNSEANSSARDITVDAFNKQNVQATLKAINQLVTILETERDKLNSTTDVTVFLSNDSLEILGL